MMTYSHNLNSISYQESYKKLLEAERWLRSKGIETDNTRFERIKENVKAICDRFVDNSIDSLISEKGNEELWFSLLEATPFESICQAFQNLKDHEIPRRKLRDILSGPFLPREEEMGNSSVNHRNYLFELELASKLRNRGITIVGFDDVKFEFEKVSFTIEYKRIFSDKSVRPNIEKAYKQLKKKLNEGQRGIIALSVEKLFKTDHLHFQATEAETEARINHAVDTFIRDNERHWTSIIDIRIVGIFVILKFIVIINPQHLLTHGFQLAIRPLCTPLHLQYTDYDRLMALGNRLSNKISGE